MQVGLQVLYVNITRQHKQQGICDRCGTGRSQCWWLRLHASICREVMRVSLSYTSNHGHGWLRLCVGVCALPPCTQSQNTNQFRTRESLAQPINTLKEGVSTMSMHFCGHNCSANCKIDEGVQIHRTFLQVTLPTHTATGCNHSVPL